MRSGSGAELGCEKGGAGSGVLKLSRARGGRRLDGRPKGRAAVPNSDASPAPWPRRPRYCHGPYRPYRVTVPPPAGASAVLLRTTRGPQGSGDGTAGDTRALLLGTRGSSHLSAVALSWPGVHRPSGVPSSQDSQARAGESFRARGVTGCQIQGAACQEIIQIAGKKRQPNRNIWKRDQNHGLGPENNSSRGNEPHWGAQGAGVRASGTSSSGRVHE